MSLLTMWLAFGFDDLFAGVVFYTVSGVLAALAALRIGRLTIEARALLRAGYGLDHVRRAILVDERASLENDGAPPRPHVSRGTLAWLAGGAIATAVSISVAHTEAMGLSLLGVGAAIVAPTIAIRRVVRDWLGGHSMLRKLTQGRFGRSIFGGARLGLEDQRPLLVAGGEPTVVAIARAADQLFTALPAEKRQPLGDVRAVIQRLEAEALALRGGDAETDEREASAVAALESLRLDLLRLNAGGAAKGELTRDLEDADRIAEQIEASLAERDEITPVPNG
jgi:hypothetical protein